MRSMMIDGTSTNASGQKREECSSNKRTKDLKLSTRQANF